MATLTIDKLILNKAKEGNGDAVEEICIKFKSIIKSVARKYFLIGGEHDDLVQEGMIGLYKSILAYSSDKGEFEPFAIMCVKRQIQTAVKQSTRLKNIFISSGISVEKTNIGDILVGESEVLEKIANEDAFSSRLKNIKKHLSALEGEVLEHYLQGLSFADIAKHSKITIKSAENSIARIKTKLKNLKLKEEEQ